VNLQTRVARAADDSGFYAFSMRIVSTPAGPALTDLSASSTHAVAATAAFHLSKPATQLVEHPRDFCFVQHTKFLRNFKKEWSTIDQTYVPRRGVKATASYDVGQTTTFSVGRSGSGDAGTFSANGTYSIAASIKGQWPWYHRPSTQDYQVNFNAIEIQGHLFARQLHRVLHHAA
jgi:hypothetical protein